MRNEDDILCLWIGFLWNFLRRRHVVDTPKLSGVASDGVHGGHCTACVANSKSWWEGEWEGGEFLHDKQPLGHYHA